MQNKHILHVCHPVSLRFSSLFFKLAGKLHLSTTSYTNVREICLKKR